jgi:mannan endo-1,4-beta-mannosidase
MTSPVPIPLSFTATSDRQAWPDARRLLAWMRSLSTRTTRRVIIGQQVQDWGDPQDKYYIDGVTAKTGKTPAMIGMSVHSGWRDSNLPALVRHWNRGGLVTLDWHPSDPWRSGGEETAWVAQGVDARSAGTRKNDLRVLLSSSPSSAAQRKWQAQRQTLGDILAALADAGVVVILRPLHESNGSWFWWGQDMTTRQTAVVDLYRDTVGYFRATRHLHNVLLSFSPAASWDGKALQYYPGDAWVDIIGPSRYSDALMLLGPEMRGEENHDDWAVLSKANKPVGFGEFGPDPTQDGTWDATTVVKRIRESYPDMVFAHAWHGWDGRKLELVAQRNVSQLMNDARVITLENIDWRKG